MQRFLVQQCTHAGMFLASSDQFQPRHNTHHLVCCHATFSVFQPGQQIHRNAIQAGRMINSHALITACRTNLYPS